MNDRMIICTTPHTDRRGQIMYLANDTEWSADRKDAMVVPAHEAAALLLRWSDSRWTHWAEEME